MDADAVIAAAIAGTSKQTFSRWTAKRKAALVKSIYAGEVTAESACKIFSLTPDELQSWMRAYDRAARDGNPVAHLHQKRMVRERTPRPAGVQRAEYRTTADGFLRRFDGATQ